MAEYLILIYDDESAREGASAAVNAQLMSEHVEFQTRWAEALRGGNALQPSVTATSLRRDSHGALAITDGAFAETKEALGGYYLIEAADLDEALKIAGDVPAPHGGVELRPIWVLT